MEAVVFVISVLFASLALAFEILLLARVVLLFTVQSESVLYGVVYKLTEPILAPARFLVDRVFGASALPIDISYALVTALMVFMRYFFMNI